MARLSTCLNSPRSTEGAFVFYKSALGSEFATPLMRFGDMPASPGHRMFNCARTSSA